ncbi:BNR repeat-containing protein [Paraflavitalea sp. CAU 1676]|uniref:BNR repeat-containing protein n=1 Tax=Paraflavitalea sp. CAU 1676 TaxID=3032598 RepID=UPI0023DB8637|nr:BNR repeat-containing protein [Paraflavitalea sp. CAU 1676]MDF2192301.1 BNR repeat-containing protein [Paraflavitalea sp. CAU 1676]
MIKLNISPFIPARAAGIFFVLLCLSIAAPAQQPVRTIPIAEGWASNSVNTVIFRKNALVTHKNWQYTAFYNQEGFVVLGKRKQGTAQWQLKTTPYKGNVTDAHNTISLMVDGDGYLHLAWDHHNHPLRYCQSVAPGSLELTNKMPMTGQSEQRVSYPEFYQLPDGNLLFLYRDGQSGQGNLVINRYDRKTKQWTSLHHNLIDGESQRNAYWQACVDTKGILHVSWVWRESPDVASNHDLAYARSTDGGKTWETSKGVQYVLPITAATAEYACRIPQNSELINQTSMYADEQGHPYIATYWREEGSDIPQYHVVYNDEAGWHDRNLAFRTTPFSLKGGGTKRIPISRPQIMVWKQGRMTAAALVFRDAERQDRVSIATIEDLASGAWKLQDLTTEPVGSWEPTYDTEWWKQKKVLQLFVQRVEQVDGEGKANLPPQTISVLEWKPVRQR